MRRVLTFLSIAAVALMASAVQAQAQVLTFTAELSGSNEAPAVPATGSGGNGTVTMNQTTYEGTYELHVFNFPTGVTASHIHVGGPGVSGPVVINFNVTPTQSGDFVIRGTFTAADVVPRAAQGVFTGQDVLQALLTGQAYLNVHSQANPSGEIRGQLRLRP